MKYIYITPFVHEDFFVTVRQGMNEAANLLGVDAEFTGAKDAHYDTVITLVEKAISERYDGIAINLAHPTKLISVLEKANSAGIPVIAFNIDSPSNPRLSAVCQDFFKAGQGLGNRIIDSIPSGSCVLFTMHDAHVGALEQRLCGIQSALQQKNVKSKVLIAGNTTEIARKNIMEAVKSNIEISSIICTGQSDTHGAGLVAQSLSEQRKLYVAGFDTCKDILQLIKKGFIDCTVDQQPYVQGFYPLLLLHQYNTLGVKPFCIDTGSAIIDSTNADNALALLK